MTRLPSRRRKSNLPRIGLVVGAAIAVGLASLFLLALPLLAPSAVRQSPYVTEFTLPTPSSEPVGIAVDAEGTVWVGLAKAKRLLSYSPGTQTFREFAIPTDAPSTMIWDVAVDPQGRIWFPSFEDNAIWRFDPGSAQFRQYPIPTAAAQPIAVAVAPDGAVWFTELRGAKLGRIPPGQDSVEEFVVPTANVFLGDLFLAADGTVWFTEIATSDIAQNGVGHFDPRTQAFTKFRAGETLLSPTGLVLVNGGIWFAEHGGSLVSKLDPESGRVTRYATSPSAVNPTSLPYWLALDAAGDLWFNEHTANRLARFDPVSETLVEYEVPTRGRDTILNILQFAVAPTGEVWFTELTENRIGVVDPRVPVPFRVEVSPRTLQLDQGAEARTIVVVNGQSNRTLQLQASGSFTGSGRLLNVTVSFEPREFAGLTGALEAVLTLRLPPSLGPGDYTLTVGATDGFVSRSIVIRLRVDALSPAS